MIKRFTIVHLRNQDICDIQDTAQDIPTFYNDLTYDMSSAKQICDLLNELSEENEELKQENQELMNYGRELLEYINSPPKHRESIFDAVVCFKDRKGDIE